MDALLTLLFQATQETTEYGDEYRSVCAALDASGDEIRSALGAEFFTRLEALEFRRYYLEATASFRDGFYTAVRLLLGASAP